MAPLIREATDADAESMVSVMLEIQEQHVAAMPQVFRPIESDAELATLIRAQINQDRCRVFVAERDDAIVGFVFARIGESPSLPVFVPRRFVEIDTIVVAKRAHRHGVGRALMERAQQWGKEQGANQAQLTVYEFNRGAIEFYETLGYATARRTMWRMLE